MGRFIFPLLTLIVAFALISVEGTEHSGGSGSGSGGKLSVGLAYREIDQDGSEGRLKRSIEDGGVPNWNGRRFQYAEEKPATIVVPQCHQEGRTLFQGLVNYYLQCIRNYRTGGFFQVIHICPRSKPASPKNCIPPANCSECRK